MSNGFRDDLFLFGIKGEVVYAYYFVDNSPKQTPINLNECSPILKSLSKLKDVVSPAMSDINTDLLIQIEISEFANKKISLNNLSYAAYEELTRNQYDVFGLLDVCLALDYDTVFKNSVVS